MFERSQTQYEKALYSSGVLNNIKIKLIEAKKSWKWKKHGNPGSKNRGNLMLAHKKLYKKDTTTAPPKAQLWRILRSPNQRSC